MALGKDSMSKVGIIKRPLGPTERVPGIVLALSSLVLVMTRKV